MTRAIDLLPQPFERGWTDLLPYGALINQQPLGFYLAIRRPGALLASHNAEVSDDPPTFSIVETVPECVHKHATQLPENERLGGEAALILAGEWTYKIFAGGRPFSAMLGAQVTIPTSGMLSVQIPVQVHHHGDGSPGAAVWRLVINCYDPPWQWAPSWQTFGYGFEDRKWSRAFWQCDVCAGELVDITLTVEGRAEAGIDFFTDDWRILLEPDAPDDGPRVPYERHYWLLPQGATLAEAHKVLDLAYPTRGTVGFSADDAGYGPGLPRRAVTEIATPTDRYLDLVGFFETYYPGVEHDHCELDGSPEPEPEPEPEPDNEPEPYPLPTRNLIGLHCQQPKTGWLDYVRQAKPAVIKTVDWLGMIIEARQAYPGTLTVYRRHVHNDGAWVDRPDRKAAVDEFLNLYSADFETHARNSGMSLYEVLQHVDVIESLNETIGHNYERNLRAIDWDMDFGDAVRRRYGYAVDAGLATIPIGNPPEDQVKHLLPLVRKACEDRHWLAYHAYWTANRQRPSPPYMLQHWKYHAGRWMEWDNLFRSEGLYPRYYLGEGGIVFARDDAGLDMSYGDGWKACGSFSYYVDELLLFNSMLLNWNMQHANRCRGLAVFNYGGWPEFDFEPGDLAELRGAMMREAP